mmetsp:Transcript_13890/g.29074  ORF Transcript_13890/g.29074 Transcript_13890/m.29074 type:complete len:479 (+) Transcript_13890:52-1488(+)
MAVMADVPEQDFGSAANAETEKKCSVDEAIKDAGYGPAQLWYNVLANGSWLADGSEALLISSLTDTLASNWSLSPSMQGTLTSMVYLGTFLGSLFSGWLGDSYGRRIPIILCYPTIIVFSVLSACTTSAGQLLITRLFVGFGFGLGQPNAVAILVELSPPRWRTLNQGFAQIAFALGELFCCFILWLDGGDLQHLGWRWLLMAGAIPALVFWVLSWLYLVESPAYVAQSDPEAAKRTVQTIRRMNGKSASRFQITTASELQATTLMRQLQVLVSRNFAWTTMVLCFVCFSYNLTIYGAFFAFPHLLPSMDLGPSALAALAIGAVIEIPFDLAGVFFSVTASRKKVLGLSLLAISGLLVLFAVEGGNSHAARPLLAFCFYGLKGLPQIASLVLFVFISEAYPVAARSTGTAVNFAVGRIGAILSSVIYKHMEAASGGHATFFILAAVLTGLSALAIVTVPAGPDEEEDPRAPLRDHLKT